VCRSRSQGQDLYSRWMNNSFTIIYSRSVKQLSTAKWNHVA
jgi:hypothetical protein